MTATPRALLVHPGTQYSGRLAAQLERHGMLSEFHTGLAFSEQGRWAAIVAALPERWSARLSNRRLPGVPPERLHTQPWREVTTLAALPFARDPQLALQRRNAAFQRAVPTQAITAANTVIGFDTSSWILARRARAGGRAFMLDQSIGHSRSLTRVAREWRDASSNWPEDVPVKSEAALVQEAEEHAQAQRVVVPSRFVARTLRENGVDEEKIRVNPFGTDLDRFHPAEVPPPLEALRFVFAGSLGPRKGLPLLLAAWSALSKTGTAELWVVGGGAIPPAVRRQVPASVRFLGRLVPADVSGVFRQAHVFVFPSYFEGLALVQVEAAASGLPVIGTENSGCEEIVRHGETGFVLPTGDVDALRETLQQFLANPGLTLAMRARLVAERNAWSWDRYGDRWATILREVA